MTNIPPYPEYKAYHTKALKPTRWERLHFRIFKMWPDSFVDKRLGAADLDRLDHMLDVQEWEIQLLALAVETVGEPKSKRLKES